MIPIAYKARYRVGGRTVPVTTGTLTDRILVGRDDTPTERRTKAHAHAMAMLEENHPTTRGEILIVQLDVSDAPVR